MCDGFQVPISQERVAGGDSRENRLDVSIEVRPKNRLGDRREPGSADIGRIYSSSFAESSLAPPPLRDSLKVSFASAPPMPFRAKKSAMMALSSMAAPPSWA